MQEGDRAGSQARCPCLLGWLWSQSMGTNAGFGAQVLLGTHSGSSNSPAQNPVISHLTPTDPPVLGAVFCNNEFFKNQRHGQLSAEILFKQPINHVNKHSLSNNGRQGLRARAAKEARCLHSRTSGDEANQESLQRAGQ